MISMIKPLLLTLSSLAVTGIFSLAYKEVSPTQPLERVLLKMSLKNEPVEIVEMKLQSGKTVQIGAPFQVEGEDWLKRIEGKIKNTSEKEIRHFQIGAIMRHVSTKEPVGKAVLFSYGGKKNMQPLLPGGTITIQFKDSANAALKALIPKAGLLSLDNILLVVDWVEFSDGTAWRLGYRLHPDANDPDKYLPDNPPKMVKNNSSQSFVKKASLGFVAPNASFRSTKNAVYNCASLEYTNQRQCGEYVDHQPCYVPYDVFFYWGGGEFQVFYGSAMCQFDGDCCDAYGLGCWVPTNVASYPSPCSP